MANSLIESIGFLSQFIAHTIGKGSSILIAFKAISASFILALLTFYSTSKPNELKLSIDKFLIAIGIRSQTWRSAIFYTIITIFFIATFRNWFPEYWDNIKIALRLEQTPQTEAIILKEAQSCINDNKKCGAEELKKCANLYWTRFPLSASGRELQLDIEQRLQSKFCSPPAETTMCKREDFFKNERELGVPGMLDFLEKCKDDFGNYSLEARALVRQQEDQEKDSAYECLSHRSCFIKACLDEYGTNFSPNRYSIDLTREATNKLNSHFCYLSRNVEDFKIQKNGKCEVEPTNVTLTYEKDNTERYKKKIIPFSEFYYQPNHGNEEMNEDCNISWLETQKNLSEKKTVLSAVANVFSAPLFEKVVYFDNSISLVRRNSNGYINIVMLDNCRYHLTQYEGVFDERYANNGISPSFIFDFSKFDGHISGQVPDQQFTKIIISGNSNLICKADSIGVATKDCSNEYTALVRTGNEVSWKMNMALIRSSVCTTKEH